MPSPPVEPNLSPDELKKRRNHGSKLNLEEGKGLLTSLGAESINIDRPYEEANFHPVHRPNGRKKARKAMKCTIPKERFFVNSGEPLVEELRSELKIIHSSAPPLLIKKAIMLNRSELMMSKFEKICNGTLVFLLATRVDFLLLCIHSYVFIYCGRLNSKLAIGRDGTHVISLYHIELIRSRQS